MVPYLTQVFSGFVFSILCVNEQGYNVANRNGFFAVKRPILPFQLG